MDTAYVCNDCGEFFDVDAVELQELIDNDETVNCPDCGSPETELESEGYDE